MPTAATGRLEKQVHPAGAIHLLNDFDTAARYIPRPVYDIQHVYDRAIGPGLIGLIRDRSDCDRSSEAQADAKLGCNAAAQLLLAPCSCGARIPAVRLLPALSKKRERNDLPLHVDRCSLPRKVVV